MAVYQFEERRPLIGESSYVHDQASVIGDVTIGEGCFIGAGAVVRGDYGKIEIGNRTSAQENCVIHARDGGRCSIGSEVQIGHGSVLHNCNVKDYAVIGLGSRICDYSTVGVWVIIAEGAVVTSRMDVPDESVTVGAPAKVIRKVKPEEKQDWTFYKQKYSELASRYKKGLKRIS